MAEQFYTIVTKLGKAKIANATALGTKVNLTKFQVGDGNGSYYNPTEDQTQLRNKVWESNISSITVDENNPNWIVLETIIPGDVGGFMIREAAALDDEGNMIAVGKYPETYKPVVGDGSTKDLVIKMILEVSNTASVTLRVDPTVILATQKDIKVLNNKIENIKVPVTSVNSKTGAIELTSEDIKTKDGQTIESQLADIVTDNNRLTQNKTITGAINELFTTANNGKTSVANAIGLPSVATETFSQLVGDINTQKANLATNLTAKSQSAVGSETLKSLVDKVTNINTSFVMPSISFTDDLIQNVVGSNKKYLFVYVRNSSTGTRVLNIYDKSKGSLVFTSQSLRQNSFVLCPDGIILQTSPSGVAHWSKFSFEGTLLSANINLNSTILPPNYSLFSVSDGSYFYKNDGYSIYVYNNSYTLINHYARPVAPMDMFAIKCETKEVLGYIYNATNNLYYINSSNAGPLTGKQISAPLYLL